MYIFYKDENDFDAIAVLDNACTVKILETKGGFLPYYGIEIDFSLEYVSSVTIFESVSLERVDFVMSRIKAAIKRQETAIDIQEISSTYISED